MKNYPFLQSALTLLIVPAASSLALTVLITGMLLTAFQMTLSTDSLIAETRKTVFLALWDAEQVASLQCVHPNIKAYRACIQRLKDLENEVNKPLASKPVLVKKQMEELSEHIRSIHRTMSENLGRAVGNPNLDEKQTFRLNNVVLARNIFSKLQHLPEIDLQAARDIEAINQLYLIAFGALRVIALAWLLSALYCILLYRTQIAIPIERICQNCSLVSERKAILKTVRGCTEFGYLQDQISQTSNLLLEGLRNEQSLIDKAAEIICSTDSERRVVLANNFACTYWNTSLSNIVGRSLDEFVVADDRQKLNAVFEETISSAQKSNCELKVISAGGVPALMRWSMFWSPAEKRMFFVAQDISEERAVQELKENLSSLLAADLRLPLLEMHEMLSTFSSRDNKKDPSYAVELEQMRNNCGKLLNLVDDLIEMQRAVSQEIILQIGEHDSKSIIANVVESLQHLAAQKSLNISISERNEKLVCDYDRIVQVMSNLLSNAIKFAPEHSTVRIELETLAAKEEQPAFLKISVHDAGPGVPAEQQQRIFQSFEQSSFEHEGTGLGLSIAKMIVESHGGSLGVISPVHRSDAGTGTYGSCFWFTLPQ